MTRGARSSSVGSSAMHDTDQIEAAMRYHERTKHQFNRYADGPGQLDWANQPNPFRRYEGAPLVAFEVVSEYDTANRLEKKVLDYLAHGTAEVWVIYPETRHARVHRQGVPEATRETEAIHSDLLPGIEIRLDEIL